MTTWLAPAGIDPSDRGLVLDRLLWITCGIAKVIPVALSWLVGTGEIAVGRDKGDGAEGDIAVCKFELNW